MSGETLKVESIESKNKTDPFWSKWSDFGSSEALHQRGYGTNEELIDFLVFTENEAVVILDDFSERSGQSRQKNIEHANA